MVPAALRRQDARCQDHHSPKASATRALNPQPAEFSYAAGVRVEGNRGGKKASANAERLIYTLSGFMLFRRQIIKFDSKIFISHPPIWLGGVCSQPIPTYQCALHSAKSLITGPASGI